LPFFGVFEFVFIIGFLIICSTFQLHELYLLLDQ
jgi:hypothetical protein